MAGGVLVNKLVTLANSINDWVKAGGTLVSDEHFETRQAACNGCPKWEKDAFFGLGQCGECGCSGVKLRLSGQKCPLDKWPLDGPKLSRNPIKASSVTTD